jgi:hypothetical protein
VDNANTGMIVNYIEIGGYADESRCTDVHNATIDAMFRLNKAFDPYLRELAT